MVAGAAASVQGMTGDLTPTAHGSDARPADEDPAQTTGAARAERDPIGRVRRGYHDMGAARRSALLSWLGFTVTFAAVRGITHAIRAGIGPFGNLQTGGEHLHHYLWGIATLAGVGGVAVHGDDERRNHPVVSIAYGCGLALIIDEFALLLDLRDVYWANQGRVSVDIGVGAVAAGGTAIAAAPILGRLVRRS